MSIQFIALGYDAPHDGVEQANANDILSKPVGNWYELVGPACISRGRNPSFRAVACRPPR